MDKYTFEIVEAPEAKTCGVFARTLLLQAPESFPAENLDAPSA
jgi:hypothetical protein